MKVGIITFHWATNYGAVLQAYALQEVLKSQGCEVEIINYKPTIYDDSLWSFVRFRKFLKLRKYLVEKRKETKIAVFRAKFLNQSPRIKSLEELRRQTLEYDIMVTGSDQVLNPSFLENGEGRGNCSTAYFLDFGSENTKRVAYAASFGVTQYPSHLLAQTKALLRGFNALSSRESTGGEIFSSMGRNDSIVVADPTLLQTREFYDANILGSSLRLSCRVRGYFLRGREQNILKTLKDVDAELIIDESIEEWLNAIRSSEHVVTNSFHGVAFCLIYNVPFTVVLPSKENKGMNDRFFTMLGYLGLIDRIVSEREFVPSVMKFSHNWKEINKSIDEYRQRGLDFLKNSIR